MIEPILESREPDQIHLFNIINPTHRSYRIRVARSSSKCKPSESTIPWRKVSKGKSSIRALTCFMLLVMQPPLRLSEFCKPIDWLEISTNIPVIHTQTVKICQFFHDSFLLFGVEGTYILVNQPLKPSLYDNQMKIVKDSSTKSKTLMFFWLHIIWTPPEALTQRKKLFNDTCSQKEMKKKRERERERRLGIGIGIGRGTVKEKWRGGWEWSILSSERSLSKRRERWFKMKRR